MKEKSKEHKNYLADLTLAETHLVQFVCEDLVLAVRLRLALEDLLAPPLNTLVKLIPLLLLILYQFSVFVKYSL